MDLSLLLGSTLGGMSKVLDDCGFNLVIQGSSEKKTTKRIHWHVEVYPKRVSKSAGLETWGRESRQRGLPRIQAEPPGGPLAGGSWPRW